MADIEQTLRAMVGDEAALEQLLSLKPTENSPEEDVTTQAVKAAEMLSALLLPRQNEQSAAQEAQSQMSGPIEVINDDAGLLKPSQKSPAVSLTAMAEVLPQIMQAISGDSSMLPDEKINLVRALRPYTSHRDSIDRAIKMAGIAKAAKSALGTLKKT